MGGLGVLYLNPTVSPRYLILVLALQMVRFDCVSNVFFFVSGVWVPFLLALFLWVCSVWVVIVSFFVFVLLFLFFALRLDDL